MTEVTKSSDEILTELFDSFKKEGSADISNGSATPKSSKGEHSKGKKKHKKEKRHKSDEKERHRKKRKCKRHKKKGNFSGQSDKSSKSKKKKKRRHSSDSDDSVLETKRSNKNKSKEVCNKENSEPEEKILKDVVKSSVNSSEITCDTSSIPLPPSIGETVQIHKVAQEIPEVKISQVSEVFEKQPGINEKLIKKSFLQGSDKPKMSIKIGNLKNSLVLEAAEEAKIKIEKYEEGEIVDETSEESLKSSVKEKTESVSDGSSSDDKKKHNYPKKLKKRNNVFDVNPKSSDLKTDNTKPNDKSSICGGVNEVQSKDSEQLEKEKNNKNISENDSRLRRALSSDSKNLKNKKSRQLRERKVSYSSSGEDNSADGSPSLKPSSNKESAAVKRKEQSKTKSGGNSTDSSSSKSPVGRTKKSSHTKRSSASKDNKTSSKSRKNSVSNRNSPETKVKSKQKGSKSRGRSSSADSRTISKDRKSRSTSRSKHKKSRSVSRSRKSRSPVLSKRKSRSPSRYRTRKSRSLSRARQRRSLSLNKTQLKRSRSRSRSRFKKSKTPLKYRRRRSRSSSRIKGKRSRSRGRNSRSLSRSRRRKSQSRSRLRSFRSATKRSRSKSRRSRSKSRRSGSKNRSYSIRDNSKSRSRSHLRSVSRNRSPSKPRHSWSDKRSSSKNKISEKARSRSRSKQSRSKNSKVENSKDMRSRSHADKHSDSKVSNSDTGDGSSSDSDSKNNKSKLKKSKRKKSGSKKLKDINSRLLALSSTKIKPSSTSEGSLSDSDSDTDLRDKKKSIKVKNLMFKKSDKSTIKEKNDSKKIKVKEDKTILSDFSKTNEDPINDSVEFKPKINLLQKIHYSLTDDEPIAMTESEMKILNAKKKSLSKTANATPSSSDIVKTKNISDVKKTFKCKGDIISHGDDIGGIISSLKSKNENMSKKIKTKDHPKKCMIQQLIMEYDSSMENLEIEDSSIKNIGTRDKVIVQATIGNVETKVGESVNKSKIEDSEIKKQTESLHAKVKDLLNDKINKGIVQEQLYKDTLKIQSITPKVRSVDSGSENELSRTVNSYDSDGQRSDTAMRNMLLGDKSYSDSDDGHLEKSVFSKNKLKYSEESSSETDEEKTFFGITKDREDNTEENNLKSDSVVRTVENSSDSESSIDKNITDSDEDIIRQNKKANKTDSDSTESAMFFNKKEDFPLEKAVESLSSEGDSLLIKCNPQVTNANDRITNLNISDIKLPVIKKKSEKEPVSLVLESVNLIGQNSSSTNISDEEPMVQNSDNLKNLSPKRTNSQDFLYEYEKSEIDEKLDFDEDKSSESGYSLRSIKKEDILIIEEGNIEKSVPNILQSEIRSVELSSDVFKSSNTANQAVNITSEPMQKSLSVEKLNADESSVLSSCEMVCQLDDECNKILPVSDSKGGIKNKDSSQILNDMNNIPVPSINKLEESIEITVQSLQLEKGIKMLDSRLSVSNTLYEPTTINKHLSKENIEDERLNFVMLEVEKEEVKSRNIDSPDGSKTSSDSQNFRKQISPAPKIKSVSRSRSRSKLTKTSSTVRGSKSRSPGEASATRKSKSKDSCYSRRSKSREQSRRSRSKDRSLSRRSKSKDNSSHSRKKKSKSSERNSHSKGRLSRSREKKRSRDRRSRSGSERSRSKDKSSRLRDRRSREQRSRSRRRATSHSRRRSRSRSRKINQSRPRDKRSRSRERRKRSRSRDKRSRSRGRRNRSRSRDRRSRSRKRRGRSESSRDKRSRSHPRKERSRTKSKERSRSKDRTRSKKERNELVETSRVKSYSRSRSPEKESLVRCNSRDKKSKSLSRSCSKEKSKARSDETWTENVNTDFKGSSISPKTNTVLEENTSLVSKSLKKTYSIENEDDNVNSSSDKSVDESSKEKSSSPSIETKKMKKSRSRSNSVGKQGNDDFSRNQKLRSPVSFTKRSRSKSQSNQKSKEKRGRSTKSKSKDRSVYKEVKTKSKERKSRSRERKSKADEKSSKSHRKRSRSKSKEKAKPRDKRSRSRERRSKSREKISRRSRTRSRSRRRKSDKKDRSRRTRSRSKSRSHKRSKKTRSRSRSKDEFFIDKSKLLEIARKNALSMMKQGAVGMDLNKVTAITAGGKTVDELTDFCKLLSQKDATGQESVSSESSSENESEKPFHHPFQLKERSNNIIMNIRNCASLPVKTLLEKTTENALQLRLQFPVSSGQLHRKSENEWVPVSPKKNDEPKSIMPAPLRKQEEEVTSYPGLQETVNFSNIPLPNSIPQAQLLLPNMSQISNPYPQPHDSGLFTGTTGARFLSQSELASGQQAWAKKDLEQVSDDLLNTIPS